MKNKFIVFSSLFFLISNIVVSQTEFTEGFNIGYKKGYCQDKSVGCIEPMPPLSPIPTVNENFSSFLDGYNRGFQMALNAQKSNSNSTDRQRYQTSSPKFIDKMDSMDYSSEIQLAIVLRESKGKALEYYQNKEYQASLNIALKGLSIKTNDEEFMILAGQALLGLKRYSESLPHLKRAYSITNNPNIKKAIYDIENLETEEKKEFGNAQNSSIIRRKNNDKGVFNNKNIRPDNFAIINIYRPKKMMGSIGSVDVVINGKVVEKLKNGGYLEFKIYDLSDTEIAIKSAAFSSLRLLPKKDNTYFFKTSPKVSGFTLEQISSPVPEEKLKKKNYSKKADYIF